MLENFHDFYYRIKMKYSKMNEKTCGMKEE